MWKYNRLLQILQNAQLLHFHCIHVSSIYARIACNTSASASGCGQLAKMINSCQHS